jgi:glycerophosphoryl diester phosphodiesterase
MLFPVHSSICSNYILLVCVLLRVGADYVEFDVQLTQDLVPVIFHDFQMKLPPIPKPHSLLPASAFQLAYPVHYVTAELFSRFQSIFFPSPFKSLPVYGPRDVLSPSFAYDDSALLRPQQSLHSSLRFFSSSRQAPVTVPALPKNFAFGPVAEEKVNSADRERIPAPLPSNLSCTRLTALPSSSSISLSLPAASSSRLLALAKPILARAPVFESRPVASRPFPLARFVTVTDLFPTLAQLLLTLPMSLGFNIEIKYPWFVCFVYVGHG